MKSINTVDTLDDVSCSKFQYHSLTQTIFEMTQLYTLANFFIEHWKSLQLIIKATDNRSKFKPNDSVVVVVVVKPVGSEKNVCNQDAFFGFGFSSNRLAQKIFSTSHEVFIKS